jgi:hypothetical protein
LFLSVLLVLHTGLHAAPGPAQKAVHLVSIEELRDQVAAQTAERTSNIREVQTLLRHQAVQDRLGHLFDLEKVAVAVPTLDNETLAELAQQSGQVNEQIRAGGMGMIIALVIAVVVVIVLAIILLNKAEDVAETVLN